MHANVGLGANRSQARVVVVLLLRMCAKWPHSRFNLGFGCILTPDDGILSSMCWLQVCCWGLVMSQFLRLFSCCAFVQTWRTWCKTSNYICIHANLDLGARWPQVGAIHNFPWCHCCSGCVPSDHIATPMMAVCCRCFDFKCVVGAFSYLAVPTFFVFFSCAALV